MLGKLKRLEAIGAFWNNRTRKDAPFFSGHITLPNGQTLSLEVYENKFHTSGDNRPTHIIYCEYGELERTVNNEPEYAPHPF